MKLEKPKTLSIKKTKKKAWGIFSRFIRLSEADENGLVKCFTCEAWGPWDLWAHAGHFIPGRSNAVLYDEEQVHAQCYNCNMNLNGNWPVYLVRMTDKYGDKKVAAMILNSNNTVQMKALDHLEVYEKYKTLFSQLQQRRENP